MASILVVDDEPKIAMLLEGELADAGHDVTVANDGDAALRLLRTRRLDAVVTDLRLGAVDGLAVLRAARKADPTMVVILLTAYASVGTAVAAMKEGAADYLEKPVNLEKLRLVLDRSLESRRLAAENLVLKQRVGRGDVGARSMVRGTSEAMRRVLSLVEKVAPTEATVLLTGESGTGKEVVARAIHDLSGRRAQPLVAVNCAALAETLLESELFGHEKGAFTDAAERKLGWFEVARRGTIFLDEIAEMRPSTQAKLLRVLEDRRFHRLGGSEMIEADARVLAATNRNLAAEIAAGRFREDLFYRLNVFPIELPPLRARREDLPELCDHFLARAGGRPGQLDAEARRMLEAYDWPGNLRELRNVLERAVILASGGPIGRAAILVPAAIRPAPLHGTPEPGSAAAPDAATLSEAEERMIRDALAKAGGNKSKAARILGITRRALYGRLARYGIAAD
jgi:DNA-binding NtrC family response regulator